MKKRKTNKQKVILPSFNLQLSRRDKYKYETKYIIVYYGKCYEGKQKLIRRKANEGDLFRFRVSGVGLSEVIFKLRAESRISFYWSYLHIWVFPYSLAGFKFLCAYSFLSPLQDLPQDLDCWQVQKTLHALKEIIHLAKPNLVNSSWF